MIEHVKRREIAHGIPRFGLQINGSPDLLEVALHLQQTVHDNEQTGKALEEDLDQIHRNKKPTFLYVKEKRSIHYIDWQEGVLLLGNS